jgi:hypothetical protein
MLALVKLACLQVLGNRALLAWLVPAALRSKAADGCAVCESWLLCAVLVVAVWCGLRMQLLLQFGRVAEFGSARLSR